MSHRQSRLILVALAALYGAALVVLAPSTTWLESSGESLAALFGVTPMGLVFAAIPLIGLWAVHGRQRALVRWCGTTWLWALCFFAMVYGQVRLYGHGDLEFILIAAAAWATAYGALVGALLLLRAVRGWRLDRVESDAAAPDCEKPQRQFTIRTLLVATSASAVFCAALSWLAPYVADQLDERPANVLSGPVAEGALIGLLAAAASLPALSAAWIVLAQGRRPWLRWTLAAITALGIAAGTVAFMSWFEVDELDVWSIFILTQEIAVFISGMFVAFIVRTCGFRLVRAKAGAAAGDQPSASMAIPRLRVGLPSQFTGALAALGVAAVLLACSLPNRLEVWKRADEEQRWLGLGWKAHFDEDGHITGLTEISRNDLGGSETLFGDLPHLKSLDFSNALLTDAQFRQYPRHCPSLAQLESLKLDGTLVGDGALDCIAESCPNLKELSLSRTKTTKAGVARLGSLNRLVRLDIEDTGVLLEDLPPLENLARLNLEGTAVDDKQLSHLNRFPKLAEIDLNRTEITDDGAALLAEMPKLENISLRMTACSEAALVKLRQALPEGTISVGASDGMLDTVLYVHVRMARGYAIALAPRAITRLHARGRHRSIRGGDDMPSGPVETITDAGLAKLSGQKQIEELDLRDSGITDAGLPSLTALTNLKSLDLRGTVVTAGACDTLARSLPKCVILR